MKKNSILMLIRWAARIWSLLAISFLLFMIIGHLFGSEQQNIRGIKDALTLAFFPTGVLIGLILAWKWEGLGGLITIGSIIELYAGRPDLILDPLIGCLAAPGLVFLIYWLVHKRISTQG